MNARECLAIRRKVPAKSPIALLHFYKISDIIID
jgi:hypothetical protein